MFCQQCGTEINTSKKFCTNCGWKIEVTVAKEEVKKVIPKEPVKEVKLITKEESNQKKEALLKKEFDDFKSGIKKQSNKRKSFINNFSSNLNSQKIVSNQGQNKKYKSRKAQKIKIGLLAPFLGICFISLLAIVSTQDSEYKYSLAWIRSYLKSDGNCCSEDYYSIKRSKSKLLVLRDIIKNNPNDTEALREKEIIDRELNLKKEKESLKTFGSYSVIMDSVEIDRDFFGKYNLISYEANVLKKGIQLENKYSFRCNGEKYDWKKEKWRTPRNRDEKSMIKDICLGERLDPKKRLLLVKNGWKQYPNYHWVKIKDWTEETSTEWKNYITNYHNPFKENITELSVDCDDNTISFLRNNDWSGWKNVEGVYKQIFADSPCKVN